MIHIKRVYEAPEAKDGARILVERLWPRGIRKADLKIDGWVKEVAPTTELRKWFNHDVSKWEIFQQRYRAELDAMPQAWQPILESARKHDVTLLFSSQDVEHNNVVALKQYLEARF